MINKIKVFLCIIILIQKCFAVLGVGEIAFLNNQNLNDEITNFKLSNHEDSQLSKTTTPVDEFNQAFSGTDFNGLINSLEDIAWRVVDIVNKHIIISDSRMIAEGIHIEDEINIASFDIENMRKMVYKYFNKNIDLDFYEVFALHSYFYKVGNCDEMSAAAAYIMRNMGVETPIDVMKYTNHTFLKVHSNPVLYVDAWAKKVYTEDKIKQNLNGYRNEFGLLAYDKNKPIEKLKSIGKSKSPLWKDLFKIK